MMRWQKLEHRFVRHLPDTLEPGLLYISMEYATASHSCCCGCGEEVVTPFSPVGWKMLFDGETVSLWPSVGNWKLRCRSHYVIDQGSVLVAPPWSDAQIEAERQRDKTAKERHFGRQPPTVEPTPQAPANPPVASKDISWWTWLWRYAVSPKRHGPGES